jgi:hypothetical protein
VSRDETRFAILMTTFHELLTNLFSALHLFLFFLSQGNSRSLTTLQSCRLLQTRRRRRLRVLSRNAASFPRAAPARTTIRSPARGPRSHHHLRQCHQPLCSTRTPRWQSIHHQILLWWLSSFGRALSTKTRTILPIFKRPISS